MIYSYKNKDTHIYIYIRICNAYVYAIQDNCSLSLEGILNVHFFYNTTNNDELAETTSSRVKHCQGIGVDVPAQIWKASDFLFISSEFPFKPPTPNSGVVNTYTHLPDHKEEVDWEFVHVFTFFGIFWDPAKLWGFSTT